MTNPEQPRSGQSQRETSSARDPANGPDRTKGKAREPEDIIEKSNQRPESLVDEDDASSE